MADLGVDGKAKFSPFKMLIQSGLLLICDEKSYLRTFAGENEIAADVIPSIRNASSIKNTLSDTNQIHQILSDFNNKKHGISAHHLLGYLSRLLFCKLLENIIMRL